MILLNVRQKFRFHIQLFINLNRYQILRNFSTVCVKKTVSNKLTYFLMKDFKKRSKSKIEIIIA